MFTSYGVAVTAYVEESVDGEKGPVLFEFWVDQEDNAGWGVDGDLTHMQQLHIARAVAGAFEYGKRCGAAATQRAIKQALGL